MNWLGHLLYFLNGNMENVFRTSFWALALCGVFLLVSRRMNSRLEPAAPAQRLLSQLARALSPKYKKKPTKKNHQRAKIPLLRGIYG